MTAPARLSVVTIGARDQPALAAFYKGLGFPVEFETDGFTAFLAGGVVLSVWSADLLTAEAGAGQPMPPAGSWTGLTLACNVTRREDVDPTWQAWVDAGATPVEAPADRPYGPRAGYVADPEGTRWEIVYADGLVYDDRGAVVSFGPGDGE